MKVRSATAPIEIDKSVYSRLPNARSSEKGPLEDHLAPSGRALPGRRRAVLAAVLIVLLANFVRAEPPPVFKVGEFSASKEGTGLPPDWQELSFRKVPSRTTYALVRDGSEVVVKATSEASASGLVRRLRVDPRQYPVLEWRWKVMNLIAKADVTRKSGDDYPARIYVTFEYDPARVGLLDEAKYEALRLLYGEYPPSAAIDYIWDGKAPRGAFVPNAFSDRVRMVVVESGGADLGRWTDERRDVLADYRTAFAADPPMISGVAIMTDSDNTGESAVAYYGDIRFTK